MAVAPLEEGAISFHPLPPTLRDIGYSRELLIRVCRPFKNWVAIGTVKRARLDVFLVQIRSGHELGFNIYRCEDSTHIVH